MLSVGSRRYQQFCGVAKALDVVGERWTLLIARDLLLGGRRFSDLQQGLAGLTPNLLSRRLKEMQQAGLIEQRKLAPPQAATVYALTELGRELEPVVLALGRFGSRWLTAPAAGDRMNARWAMLSLKRRYVGCPRAWCISMTADQMPFTIRIGDERAEVHDGLPSSPDLTLTIGRPGLPGLLGRRTPARVLVEQGLLECKGPAQALVDFAEAFEFLP